MGDAAFAQLLRIRNMRADNLARELSEAERHLEHLGKARTETEAELREMQARANAVLLNVLQPGHRVDGKQLQRAVDVESALRVKVSELSSRRDELERERAAVEIEVARCARELRRARQTALRTELLLEEIDREPAR